MDLRKPTVARPFVKQSPPIAIVVTVWDLYSLSIIRYSSDFRELTINAGVLVDVVALLAIPNVLLRLSS
jgi:hypothetical protein